MVLSEAARSVWAKSPNAEGAWLPLWRHMDDSADVAGWLVDRWLAPSVLCGLAAEFGGSVADARTALVFLAGVHDAGKATPAFAVQNDLLAYRMRLRGLGMPERKQHLADREYTHHSLAGHHLLVNWLRERGWGDSARSWGVVLAGHHGAPPDASAMGNTPEIYPDPYGTKLWCAVQHELVERVAVRTGAVECLDRWRDIQLSAGFQVVATGLVIVSDWIASNEELFPYLRGELPEVAENPGRASRALADLRLPPPWRPNGLPEDVATLFATRFELPPGATPRPVQHAACEVVRDMGEPGLVIVEAPMGEGKTEAAFAAAELFAEKFGAGGILVALPTQATSDAMFDRVVDWLDAIAADGQSVGGAITLSHGKARFNRLFQGLVRAGKFRDIGRDEVHDQGQNKRKAVPHKVVAHAWLSGRKKAALANFVVGTIDQLLFAGLKSRHLMLRHLGLAGKVVVLDEVHAYDAYMNSYLTKVLTWLGAYRVPVLALSATLPSSRRRELLEAYRRGQVTGAADHPGVDASQVEGDIGYPVLSWSDRGEFRTQSVAPSGRGTQVQVELLDGEVDDDLDALVELLRDALSEGGCAAVVRNTVRRVLATARRLEAEFPGEVTIAHSRFITADRMRKDSELLDWFGAPDRCVERPTRHIVIASQVIEQSLDVDFDLLVTDLAPVDLVLQRMGRLHRHQRGEAQADRPLKVRSARAYLTGVNLTGEVPELEQAAAKHVYDEYSLLRSAAVLRPHLGDSVVLPEDIPRLVQRAYGPDAVGPEQWQSAITDARERLRDSTDQRTRSAKQFQISEPSRPGIPIVGWVSADAGEPEDDAQGQGQVRDGAPSLEAILVYCDDAGRWWTPHWLTDGTGGREVPRDATPPDELAEIMAACSLRLPLEFSDSDAEDELWHATPPEWEESPLVYRIPVLVVDDNGDGELAGRRLSYTHGMGLEVFKDQS